MAVAATGTAKGSSKTAWRATKIGMSRHSRLIGGKIMKGLIKLHNELFTPDE